MDDQQAKKEIQKGFNAGYLLEKLNPKLSQKLRMGITEESEPYMLGFAKGAEQYNNESFFDSPPPSVPDRGDDLGRDDLDKGTEKDLGIEP